MPNLKPIKRKATKLKSKPVIGIALGGGGPMGGIYEIGALRAIDEALEGLDLNKLDHYVGVNAGSFVAANLANQITTAQMCRIFIRHEADVHPFHPHVFYRPALHEYWSRIRAVPSLFMEAVSSVVKKPSDQSLLEYLTVMAQAVPAGIFDNEGFHDYIARAFNSLGRTNDFALLDRSLMIIAADLESGETVRFGETGNQDIPISKAIQSSMASPGVYMPVEYEGRYYMDGTLNKGMHSSVAFEAGCDIVLALNPVVPVDIYTESGSPAIQDGLRDKIIGSGMGNVLAQSYRTMVHSRLYSGLKNIKREYPKGKLFLFEPTKAQARMFLGSVFSFETRKQVCEQAYQTTRHALLEQADELEEALAPLGVRVRRSVLEDSGRRLSSGLYAENLPQYEADPLKTLGKAGKKKDAGARENRLERATKRVAAWF